MRRPPRPPAGLRAACDCCGKAGEHEHVLVAPRTDPSRAQWLGLCEACLTRPGRTWRLQYVELDGRAA